MMPRSIPTLNLLAKYIPSFMYSLSFSIYCILNQDDQLVFHITGAACKKNFKKFSYKTKIFKHAHFPFSVT